MPNRKIKFRFWSPQGKAFVQNYNYNGPVDELFDEKEWRLLIPCQFTGLQDFKGNDVYENDIILLIDSKRKYKIGFKFGSFCAEPLESISTLSFVFMHQLGRFEVVGNALIDLDSSE